MVMTTSKPASPRLADLTRQEAETLTGQIKENFDSLGNMLLAARDRKAYKVLGYRTFESYCQSEFGKSSSTAYQAIEDAKVRSLLEAHISENYGEEVTLKIPSSHLRPLKAVEDIDNKLKAIEFAQKLAANEGKKPTRQHLEIAVFEITGKRSEDFRSAIQKLGFIQGVQVETLSPIKKDRGIVRKIDKLGKIHVEHYYGGNKAIEYDATELRILTKEEKPASPLEGSVAAKGDRVLIFAEGLQSKKGTIYTWNEGKQTLVMVDGQTSPSLIAYAEMELLRPQSHSDGWEDNLTWNTGNNTAYYFTAATDRIHCNKWPVDLYIQPYHSQIGPIKTMEKWEANHSLDLMKALATPANTKLLALTQAVELPDEQGKEFAADLIDSLLQLFPDASPQATPQKALGISFSKTINELISGKKTQTRRAWQDDYAKSFIRYFDENIAIPALDKGRHRGGRELGFIKLTQRPYQQYLSEMSATDLQEEGGMVETAQEFIDTFFEGQDKLVWVLHFEFLPAPASNTDALIAENQRLREQLSEAEATIQEIVNATSTASPLEPTEKTDFLTENTSETSSPGDTVAHCDSWRQLLEDKGFTPVPYELNGYFRGSWRGWNFFFSSPNGGVTAIDIANEKEEMWARCTEIDFDIDLGNEEAIINWTKEIINQIEDFCPGQLSLNFIQSNPNSTTTISAADIEIISARRERILNQIEEEKELLAKTGDEKKRQKLRVSLNNIESQLEDLDKFENFQSGDLVTKTRFPEKRGTLLKLELTKTGMPFAWVQWLNEYGEACIEEQHPLGVLTNLSGREM